MSLVLRTRNHPYTRFVNSLMEDNRRRMGMNEFETTFGLAIDVQENEDAYTVYADLPGINLDDINVNIHDDVLTISAETHAEEYDENTRVLARERRTGKFSRSLRFPVAVDGNNISADFDNGVLSIVVPKAEEAKPRQIPVNVVSNTQ